MRRRREFYEENETCRPANPLDSGQVFDELYITSDDVMHLSLEYMTDDEKLRVLYFREISQLLSTVYANFRNKPFNINFVRIKNIG